jgi:hypothetical protein
MKIPDAVTNRIDLDRFNIPDNINPANLAGFIQRNASKLPTDAWYKASVGPKLKTDKIVKLLQSGLTYTKYLTTVIIANMLVLAPMMNVDFNQLTDKPIGGSVIPASQQGNGGIGAPSKNRYGGYWTGD